nr:hypothetical protein [uncultured Duganella sp.]
MDTEENFLAYKAALEKSIAKQKVLIANAGENELSRGEIDKLKSDLRVFESRLEGSTAANWRSKLR